jgi:predicted transcriptional regulator
MYGSNSFIIFWNCGISSDCAPSLMAFSGAGCTSTIKPSAPIVTPAPANALTRLGEALYTEHVEVHFTPEQEARLSKIATQEGVDPEKLVKDAALRLLEDDVRFRAGVRKGLEQVDRGEFIEEEEMDARVKRMFRS